MYVGERHAGIYQMPVIVGGWLYSYLNANNGRP
jgi:hypothetical protein